MLGWRILRGRSGGATARGSAVRTMGVTRENIRGPHCGSLGRGGTGRSRVAERTVIGVLPARVRRDRPWIASRRIVVGRTTRWRILRGRRGGAIARGSTVRTIASTREDIRGRHSSSPGATVLRGAGLPSAPSSERCTPVSRVALRCGLPNCCRSVGGMSDRMAESAWKVRWAPPSQGSAVRPTDRGTL
jgi:hypothetical protein